MMRGEVQIDRPNRVIRAHQLLFLIPGEVAQIDRTKLAVGDYHADRHRVIGVYARLIPGHKAGTSRIGPAAPGKRGLQHLAVGGDHRHRQAGERNRIPGHNHRVLDLAVHLRVHFLESRHLLSGLRAGAVIDEMRDRDPGGQFLQAAHMVAVVVGQQQVVDLLHAGRLNGRHDTVGIAAPGAAGIDEERLAGGGDIQRRVPTLGVDKQMSRVLDGLFCALPSAPARVTVSRNADVLRIAALLLSVVSIDCTPTLPADVGLQEPVPVIADGPRPRKPRGRAGGCGPRSPNRSACGARPGTTSRYGLPRGV